MEEDMKYLPLMPMSQFAVILTILIGLSLLSGFYIGKTQNYVPGCQQIFVNATPLENFLIEIDDKANGFCKEKGYDFGFIDMSKPSVWCVKIMTESRISKEYSLKYVFG